MISSGPVQDREKEREREKHARKYARNVHVAKRTRVTKSNPGGCWGWKYPWTGTFQSLRRYSSVFVKVRDSWLEKNNNNCADRTDTVVLSSSSSISCWENCVNIEFTFARYFNFCWQFSFFFFLFSLFKVASITSDLKLNFTIYYKG